VSGSEEYAETVKMIHSYVADRLTAEEGGFYSAEDADSEGEEGRFYTWELSGVEELLETHDAALCREAFGIDSSGNYLEEANRTRNGRNILFRSEGDHELAERLGLEIGSLKRDLERIRETLFNAREKRIRPHRDDKVLTDWNGLMIAAFAGAYQVFEEEEYLRQAQAACGFILERMLMDDGGVYHRYRGEEAAIPGFLSDYAGLCHGLFALYEATFDSGHLARAQGFMEYCLEHFWDEKGGGFFMTSDQAEKLLLRTREIYDGAVPSGNAVMFLNLLKLGHMTGDSRYLEKADGLWRAFSSILHQHPVVSPFCMAALDFYLGPTHEIVVAGTHRDRGTEEMIGALRRPYIPNKVLLLQGEGDGPGLSDLAPFAESQRMMNDRPTCYVCTDFACSRPTNDVQEVLRLLRAK
jgi:uncharacterized protein YyaL (SSP411 family)